jgi:N6-adenosine-specific RNA methylase IME4
MKKYNVIYADPPWTYKDKCLSGKRGVEFKYDTMTIDDIKNLNVKDIADDNCMLFIWTTFPMMQECLDVIKAWGFKYRTVGFVWIKLNKIAKSLFWGMGAAGTRANAEVCLMAVKGKPKRVSAGVHSVVMSVIEKHSKKPDVARERIVQLCGDVPRIELFARESTAGWDVLGDNIDGKDIRDILK